MPKSFNRYITEYIDSNFHEAEQHLNDKGVYGRMKNLWEDTELTFGELKEIISSVIKGNIQTEEKLDGVALSFTWKDNAIKTAVDRATVSNPVTPDKLEEQCIQEGNKEKGVILGRALTDIENALKGIDEDTLNELFCEGNVFVNCEIVNPALKNVVDYAGRSFVKLHNAFEFNTKTGKVKKECSELMDKLCENGVSEQEYFNIVSRVPVNISEFDISGEKEKHYLDRFNELMNEYNLNEGNTLGDYYERAWREYIDLVTEANEIEEPVKKRLINRWAFNDSTDMNSIKEMVSFDKTVEWLNDFEENGLTEKSEEITDEVSDIVMSFSAEILENVEGTATLNENITGNKVEIQLDQAYQQLRYLEGDNSPVMEKAERDMNRYRRLRGNTVMPPIEGVVFQWKNRTYKLTGVFEAVRRITG